MGKVPPSKVTIKSGVTSCIITFLLRATNREMHYLQMKAGHYVSEPRTKCGRGRFFPSEQTACLAKSEAKATMWHSADVSLSNDKQSYQRLWSCILL